MFLCEDPSMLVSYLYEWNNLSKLVWIYRWRLQCAFAIIVPLFLQNTGSYQCPVETGEHAWHWVIDDWPVARVDQFSIQWPSLLYTSFINCFLGWMKKCHPMKWICLVWLQLKEQTNMNVNVNTSYKNSGNWGHRAEINKNSGSKSESSAKG